MHLFTGRLKEEQTPFTFYTSDRSAKWTRKKMSWEKSKPLACDILLSAGISVADRCSVSPSPLYGHASNHRRAAVLPCTHGCRGTCQERMLPATTQWPGKSCLFPDPVINKGGVGRPVALHQPARRLEEGQPPHCSMRLLTKTLFFIVLHPFCSTRPTLNRHFLRY